MLSLLKDESYGSIDELLGRYIAPMNDYVEELVNHRKFVDLPEDEVDKKLKEQKRANPQSIPYALCWLEMHPGYASLRFVASSTPRNHHVGINPKGFSWGTKQYSNLDKLINDFKKNPRGSTSKPKDRPPPPRPAPPSDQPTPRSRFGPRPTPPPPEAPSGWNRPPAPPLPPAALPVHVGGGGWGAPVPVQHGGWSSQPAPPRPPPPRPPPPNLPPPPAYRQPPPRAPPPPSRPPPPPLGYGGPPPGAPPPPHQQPTAPFGMPPQADAGRGRGRGKTLPAWMTKQGS